MKAVKIIIFSLVLTQIFGCSGSSSNGSPTAENQSCDMNGTWTICQTDNTDSQKLTLVILNSSINQTIDSYPGVVDCSGTPSGNMTLSLSISKGIPGQSAQLSGGTDLQITPQGFDMGCGADTPAYNAIKFSSSCTRFQTTDNACSQNAVSSTLGPDYFTKQ